MIQVLEAVLVFITLLFCSKKKPKKLNADATETMESVTKDSTLDSIEIHESRNEHDEESEEELEEKRTNEDEEKKESEEKPENGGTEENH
jgi:flagellar biosynthesis/type III secretory pathway M-ring protein FliF/YscJ